MLVDTHLDTAPDVGGELLSHCCPITRAVDAGFDPAKIVLVGISGWMNPRTELEYCSEHGITVIWLEEIWEHGTALGGRERARGRRRRPTASTCPSTSTRSTRAHAVGTCCPTPGGLTSREAIELTRGVAVGGLIGVDVVEIAPSSIRRPWPR